MKFSEGRFAPLCVCLVVLPNIKIALRSFWSATSAIAWIAVPSSLPGTHIASRTQHQENEERHQALIAEIKGRSLSFLPGVGQHPGNKWPGEQSVLVLGLSLEAAKTLGRRFEQNAVVWTGKDGVPELVLSE
jgi:hypothetical protein